MAIRAVIVDQEIVDALEASLCRSRWKALAAARIADVFRRDELDLIAAITRCADPIGDPTREDGRARARIGFPAVVAARHFLHEQRLRRRTAIDDRSRLLVGRVHIIGAREGGCLTTRVVTGAATGIAADVLPEIDTESLYVLARWSRTAVRGSAVGRRSRIVRDRVGPAATAAEHKGAEGDSSDKTGCVHQGAARAQANG